MAIQIPETLYTGGNVRFDSSPSTNLFLRLQQQRQAQETAKKEALNQYFTDAIKQVNPAGIREVHLRGPQGGILDDIEKWKQWSIQNKNEIAKGGAARMESDMMVSEIARKIQQAKKRDQTFLEIGRSQFEGKFDPDEDDLKIVDKMSRSIYDPESYKQDRVSEYGYSDLSPNLPQYDPLKGFESFTKGMKTGKTFDEGKGRRDPQTGLEWIPYTEKFAEPQIKQIALNAAGEYESNRVAKKYWDNQFKSITEPELAELNKTFKRYFGSVPIKGADGKIIDVSNINTAQDYAAAVTALKAEGFIGEQGEVPKSDYQRRQQDQINKIYISDALIRDRQRSDEQVVSGNAFDDLADNNFKNFDISGGVFYNKDGTPKSGTVFLSGQYIPATVKSALKVGGIDPDYLIGGVDAVVENGRIKSISNQAIGTITREAMEGVYQRKMDTERKSEPKLEFSGGKGGTKPSGAYSNVTQGTYNGKKVTIGQKNGKWYDIKTGQELK